MKTTRLEVLNDIRTKKIMNIWNDSHSIQRALILEKLIENFWKEVPIHSIFRIKWINIYQYNARILELRRMWFIIDNRIENFSVKTKVFWKDVEIKKWRKSFFKLIWIN